MDYGTLPELRTLWQARAQSGEPTGTVTVTNLASVVAAGHDAWGRPNKPQPIFISVAVSLAHPFLRARQTDQVAADTVHYGLLCKAVLSTLNTMNLRQVGSIQNPRDDVQMRVGGDTVTLRGVLERIWVALTGVTVAGLRAWSDGEVAEKGDEVAGAENGGIPFLNLDLVKSLEVSVKFPKASLLGSGVSLTAAAVFHEDAGQAVRKWRVGVSGSVVKTYAVTLKLHEMRVPTLIGINDNERKAKQIVVTDVQIDRYDVKPDTYTILENIVLKVMNESAFGTLEALAERVASIVKREYIPEQAGYYDAPNGWQIKIKIMKPTAVPMAESAGIEYISM